MDLMATVLEQYSRMICGQMNTNYIPSIEHALYKEQYTKYKEQQPDPHIHMIKVRDQVNKHLEEIKKLIWTEFKDYPSANYGIGYHYESDLAYDMYKSILHQKEKEKKEECEKSGTKYHSNVHSSKPSSHTNQPFMKVEILDPRETKLERILKQNEK